MRRKQQVTNMNAIQLDSLTAQAYRDMGVVVEDEDALRRVAKYLRRMVKSLTSDPTQMTKEEFLEKIEAGEQAYANGECHEMLPDEDLSTYLRRRGYDL